MEFKEFQNHWAPWDSMFGYFLSPSLPTNGFLQLFWKFPNFKFEIFNPPPTPTPTLASIGGGGFTLCNDDEL